MSTDTTTTHTPGQLLLGAIEAEFTGVRYSVDARLALEGQLSPFGSIIQSGMGDIVERLRNEYTGTRVPPASMVLKAVKYAGNLANTGQKLLPEHSQRYATPEEIDLIMRAYQTHGTEYAAKLSRWMETGTHDYAEIQAALPARKDDGDLASRIAGFMQR